jgi:hypothetical protein
LRNGVYATEINLGSARDMSQNLPVILSAQEEVLGVFTEECGKCEVLKERNWKDRHGSTPRTIDEKN